MTKKKPIGYTKEQTQSMKTLVERTQKDAGDYVGSGTVTEAPKKKKMKRMMDGGMAGMADNMARKRGGEPRYKTMPIEAPAKKIPPEMMDRIGRGVATAKQAIKDRMGRAMPRGADMMDRMGRAMPMPRGAGVMRGGGLARKGVGMALAKGGMVKANGCAKRGKTRGKMM